MENVCDITGELGFLLVLFSACLTRDRSSVCNNMTLKRDFGVRFRGIALLRLPSIIYVLQVEVAP